MTGLTGNAIGVLIDDTNGVNMIGMAGFTALQARRTMKIHFITTAGNLMFVGGMAALTAKIQAIHVHVDIKLKVWMIHRHIQIAVLDVWPPATVKVTCAAVFPGRHTHTLGGGLQIYWRPDFAVGLPRTSREDLFFIRGITGTGRELLVRTGLVMADQTIHGGFPHLSKCFSILVAIPHMTTGATRLVRGNSNTIVIDNVVLA